VRKTWKNVRDSHTTSHKQTQHEKNAEKPTVNWVVIDE